MKSKFLKTCLGLILFFSLGSTLVIAGNNDPVKPLNNKPTEESFNVSYEVETIIYSQLLKGEDVVENSTTMPIITLRKVDAAFNQEGQFSFSIKYLTPENELYSKTKDWYEHEIPNQVEGASLHEAKIGEVVIRDGVLTLLTTTGQTLQTQKLDPDTQNAYSNMVINLRPECQKVYDFIKKSKENGCEVNSDGEGKICITCRNTEGGTVTTVIDTNKSTISSVSEFDAKGNPRSITAFESECKDMKTIIKKIVQEVYEEIGGQASVTTIISNYSNYTVN